MPDIPLTTCLFCGKTNFDVPRMVANSNTTAAICAPCVMRSIEILISGRDELAEPVVVTTPEGDALAHRIVGGVQ